jgi:hypothetical protein
MWRSKFDLEPLASEARENARHYACKARHGDKDAPAHATYWKALGEAIATCQAAISKAAVARVRALGVAVTEEDEA